MKPIRQPTQVQWQRFVACPHAPFRTDWLIKYAIEQASVNVGGHLTKHVFATSSRTIGDSVTEADRIAGYHDLARYSGLSPQRDGALGYTLGYNEHGSSA
jgi:hypothetical protein